MTWGEIGGSDEVQTPTGVASGQIGEDTSDAPVAPVTPTGPATSLGVGETFLRVAPLETVAVTGETPVAALRSPLLRGTLRRHRNRGWIGMGGRPLRLHERKRWILISKGVCRRWRSKGRRPKEDVPER